MIDSDPARWQGVSRYLQAVVVVAAMRTVIASGRVPGRGGQAVRAILNGLGLGLLSDDQLRALDERYYEREADYRSAAWNERGLAWWEREEVARSFAPRSRIAVPACGGGREVLALLADGFDAIGYESHPALSAYAQTLLARHGYPGRALPAPRDSFPDRGPCDGVLVGWGAYSLIGGRERRVAFLRQAAAATATGGPVMLSFFERPVHGRQLRATWSIAVALRRLGGASSVDLGDTLAPNRIHVFTREQLSSELQDSGLALGSYRVLVPADPITRYACAIGRVQ